MEQARRALGDLLAGAVLVGLAAVGLASLSANPDLATYEFGADPGPGLFPRLLLWALLAGGVALAAGAAWTLIRSRPGKETGGAPVRSLPRPEAGGPPARMRPREPWITTPGRFVLPVLFVGSLAIYIVAMRTLGFRATTAAFAAAWIFVLGRQQEGRWTARWAALAVAGGVLTAAVTYTVFRGFVKVPLP
ncbi:MAG: tripartite tricarboxylate transporter TctB family protein [Armatimonadota bacterium]|nr:tripartite tricarboxylate transporter TctB family protein [Armatimonadota bacterium]MDR7428110.1 tripartite tricarboxylate transporter TctB family protein [Armatimonadota bacterium]MDR7464453.1 tripartite tricarboxylate transporter TctB family protein [Armatimonadota bacterium]MDR7470503.1 tripartite tricarboxylate transporter TctB family protein [Armatimonadota bacterium]MDR7475475.1 tripartite tricarboxylate transporter TctB family protein [Armatimonadota bacterium]